MKPNRPFRSLTALGAALTAACSGSEPEDPRIAQGRALYETNCLMCHGEEALGGGPMASTLPVEPVSLIEHLGHHTMDELVTLVTSGIPPAMPPAPVSADEVALIVDYVWTLVPEDRVEELREMQRMMEEMGSGTGAMPGMGGMDGGDMQGMDHGEMEGMDRGDMPMGGN